VARGEHSFFVPAFSLVLTLALSVVPLGVVAPFRPDFVAVVLLLLGLYEFILFWIDGVADRTVPLIERWAPPLTGTLLWLVMFTFFDAGRREARARF